MVPLNTCQHDRTSLDAAGCTHALVRLPLKWFIEPDAQVQMPCAATGFCELSYHSALLTYLHLPAPVVCAVQ
jgi:hypothetical protein